MRRYEQIIDYNFKNGKLFIIANRERRWTIGRFEVYNEKLDKVLHYVASATCHPDDRYKYSFNTGLDIVKTKLMMQYYNDIKKHAKKQILAKQKELKPLENTYNHADKKLANIKAYLEQKYDLMYD